MSIPSIVTYDAKNVEFPPYGEYWRQSKSMYVLHFLSGRRVLMYKQVREDETNLMIDQIQNTSGSVINLSEILMSLTNDVICRIVLGKKNSSKKIMGQMGELMEVLSIFSIGTYFPSLSWVDRLRGLEARARKLAKEMDEFFESEMFVAGTDTTSTSLEWAISELIRHPRVMKKLQQEVGGIAKGKARITEEDLEIIKHPYLEGVLKETLRVHTPLPLLVPRESTQDVKLNYYDIAAGTQVMINVWMISRDPAVWEDPEEFKPERFVNNNIDYKGLHFEFLPFGAGRRGCPGIQFGMAITKLALANLVYRFNFELPNKGIFKELDMSVSTGLTIHRKNPLKVVATPCF
nr:cytochrome P450 71A2-like [Tanacetum cinerariifolium]